MTPPKAPPAPGRTRYILQVYDPAQVDPRRPGVKPWQFKTLDLPSDFTLEEVNAEASVWLTQQYPELVFDKARGIWRG
jgi:hypothetical protein